MIGWLIAFGVLFLLAIFPLGILVRYHDKGFFVDVTAGFLRFRLYPRKKKEENKAEDEELESALSSLKKAKDKLPKKDTDKPKEKGGKLRKFMPYARTALDFLGELRQKIRVKRLELKVIMAGDDPCDLALNYGRAWAAVGNLYPVLERTFVINRRKVEVECDFTADETRIIGRLDITITLGRLIALAVRYGIRVLRVYLKIRKGGACK